MGKYQDKLNEFGQEVLKAIENGNAPWQKPWKEGELLEIPKNATTNNGYRGVNLINLALSGYNDPRWLTFVQAKKMDCKVRKGEKSRAGFYYSPSRLEKKLENGKPVLDDDGKEKMMTVNKPVFRTFALFNATQVEGMEPYKQPEPSWKPEEKAEKLLNAAGMAIVESQLDQAFYRPSTHTIETPFKAQFRDKSEYYSTVFHELGHATGHPSMLNRDKNTKTKDGKAKEELRAEISAWLVCTQIGIGYDPKEQDNNKNYVGGWLSALKDKDRAKELGFAMKDAEKIANYILALDKGKDQVLGQSSMAQEQEKYHYIIADESFVGISDKETLVDPWGNEVAKFNNPNDALEAALSAKVNMKELEDDKVSVYRMNEFGESTGPLVSTSLPIHMKAMWEMKIKTPFPEHFLSGEKPIFTPGQQVAEKTYINVPYAEKNEAKSLGAKWDNNQKSWFIGPNSDKQLFQKWLEPQEKKGVDMQQVAGQFQNDAAQIGVFIDNPIADGKKHRVRVEGDTGKKMSGEYVLHPDGRPAGYVKNFRTDEFIQFKFKGDVQLDRAFKRADQLIEDRQKGFAKAAKTAFGIYVNAEKTTQHPYLKAKGVNGTGKEYRQDKNRRLIIPGINPKTKKIETLQFINSAGEKQFLTGGKKTGNCHILGDLDENKPVLLAEGYSTGKTLHDISNLPAVVCFDANNLENVAKQIRELMPSADLYFCADNDHALKNNVGVEKAQKAADAVGGEVIIPKFSEASLRQGMTDFNDLSRCKMGKSRIERQLQSKIKYLSKDKGLGIER